MQKAFEYALHEFDTLHTGKASPSMVEGVVVDAYGSSMRLKEVGAITTPDSRMITIQPWDKGLLKAIEKAIAAANLGFNPSVFGDHVRCPVPELNKQRRQELAKRASGMAEEGRVRVRNARRDAIEALKKEKNNKQISEDDYKRFEKEIQHETDKFIEQINKHLDSKEKELLTV